MAIKEKRQEKRYICIFLLYLIVSLQNCPPRNYVVQSTYIYK